MISEAAFMHSNIYSLKRDLVAHKKLNFIEREISFVGNCKGELFWSNDFVL